MLCFPEGVLGGSHSHAVAVYQDCRCRLTSCAAWHRLCRGRKLSCRSELSAGGGWKPGRSSRSRLLAKPCGSSCRPTRCPPCHSDTVGDTVAVSRAHDEQVSNIQQCVAHQGAELAGVVVARCSDTARSSCLSANQDLNEDAAGVVLGTDHCCDSACLTQ